MQRSRSHPMVLSHMGFGAKVASTRQILRMSLPGLLPLLAAMASKLLKRVMMIMRMVRMMRMTRRMRVTMTTTVASVLLGMH